MARPPRIRIRGATTGQWATTYVGYTPRPHELCFDTTTGKYRVGDGETLYADLDALSPSAAEIAVLTAEVNTHENRLDLIEASEPPPPDPETAVLKYAAVSYIFPSSSGQNADDWATLQANAAAGKLAFVLMNQNNGPGYEAKYEPGGSTHTAWTNKITPIANADVPVCAYISTNYGDLSSASGSHKGAGTVGGNYRITCATNDEIKFWNDGTISAAGGALGSARLMTFQAGAGPFAIKSWYSGSAAGVALPGGTALSTSYYLRPVGATPTQTYTMHTSKAGAENNTGKVNITDTGGGSGLGPFFIGFRRNLANIATVHAEMTRSVTLFPDLVNGWFFDECQVDEVSHDAWFDSIVAYRDANHPGMLLVMNGTPHNATRANMYDVFVMENNWSAFADKATGTLTFTGIPSNNQTVTIGAKVYTWQDTLTNVDGNVKIGANAAACVTNLVAAIMLGSGAGTLYAAATTANAALVTAVDGTGDTVVVSSKRRGTSGNSIDTTETMSNASWGAATLTGGDWTGSEAVPSYVLDDTVPPEKAWAIIHDDVQDYDLADCVTFCTTSKVGLVYINGPSAFGQLPSEAEDGFTQADVIAAIDVANA